MQNGLIHIYCGDGKGKTTAAVGLSLRCHGAGGRVLFVQFFKDGSSCEIGELERLGIETLICRKHYDFYYLMNEDGRRFASDDYTALLRTALGRADNYDFIVLDEVLDAFDSGAVSEKPLHDYLDSGVHPELVLTGRNPSSALRRRADYITEMKKQKHPYDAGISARKGIEF